MSEVKLVGIKELDYSKKAIGGGRHRYVRTFPESEIGALALNGTTSATFTLPQKAFNLSKSHLDFTMSIAAGSTFHKIHTGCMSAIDSIYLRTKSGVEIAVIRDVGNYTKLVWPVTHKLDEFQNLEGNNATEANAAANILARSKGFLFSKSDTESKIAPAGGLQTGQILSSAGALLTAGVNYNAPTALLVGATTGTVIYYDVSLPLGEFVHTVLATNRDYYWGEQLQLEVVFQQGVKMSFNSVAEATVATPIAQTGVSSIVASTLRLWLAIQEDPAIVSSLMGAYQRGLTQVIPFVHLSKYSKALGTAATINRRLNSGYGKRLLRNYVGVFHDTETGLTAFNNANESSTRVTHIRTSMNSVPMQDYQLSNASNECYNWLKDKLKCGVIQNSRMYNNHWVWIDDFTPIDACDWKQFDDHISGLDMGNEDLDYTVELTTENKAHKVYIYSVVQKMLSISSNGISVQ